MDAQQIRQLKPKLDRYLKRFADCFVRKDTRGHFPVYVEGQLSDLHRKSVEPIAKEAGVPVRTLQEFLSLLKWDEERMRDRLQAIVAAEHASPRAVGVIDETSFAKQGDKTPGVKRQYCGSSGKTENCMVTVHLAYAADGFHCLLDGELYLPQDWHEDRERCRKAGIPEEMVYRPKWEIALELWDRSRRNGVVLRWATFDEGYGGKPGFLAGLRQRGQDFAGEVPSILPGWLDRPRVTRRPYRRHGRGRGRRMPRVSSGSPRSRSVKKLLQQDPRLRDQPWKRYYLRNGSKGPMVWEAKHTWFYPKDEDGLPGPRLQLAIARNVFNPKEIKFFLGDAPPGTSVGTMLLVGFSRWHVERCFEDQKDELGLDHYEGRRYPGLKRHLILSAVSYLFLSQVQRELGEKNPGTDNRPGPRRRGRADRVLVAQRPGLGPAAGETRREDPRHAAGQCQVPSQPQQADPQKVAGITHPTDPHRTLPVEHELAL
jgi:SRSO17 transposase